ncbi:hypothetical protein SAMN05444157_3592 [Frankineae bacterium MT45]|nr:hypothetical protein SAMN05444157_3592 [Frankineae bacterium MT45]
MVDRYRRPSSSWWSRIGLSLLAVGAFILGLASFVAIWSATASEPCIAGSPCGPAPGAGTWIFGVLTGLSAVALIAIVIRQIARPRAHFVAPPTWPPPPPGWAPPRGWHPPSDWETPVNWQFWDR